MRNNHASDYVAEFVNLLFIISGRISAQFCNNCAVIVKIKHHIDSMCKLWYGGDMGDWRHLQVIWRIGGICMSRDMEEIRRHLCMNLTLLAKNLEFLIFEYKFLLLIEIVVWLKSTQITVYTTLKQFLICQVVF